MHSSPMLRFSLELYLSALRLHARNDGFDRKLAVLNLAQCVELATKAALVEENESIYTKDSKTLSTHSAREALASKWERPFPFGARIELLVDERNAMQHRYGDVDPLTLLYHLETVSGFLRKLLVEKFEMDLDDYVRLTDANLALSANAVVRPAEPTLEVAGGPSESVGEPGGSHPVELDANEAIGALLTEFARFERAFRERIDVALGSDTYVRSMLDVAMKFAARVHQFPVDVRRIPRAFSLRNATVHGTLVPKAEQLEEVRSVLAALVKAGEDPQNLSELRQAAEASVAGVLGTRSDVRRWSATSTPVLAGHDLPTEEDGSK